jgi:hypothetical protein
MEDAIHSIRSGKLNFNGRFTPTRSAPANAGGARDSVDLSEHAPTHRGVLRLSRYRPTHPERLEGTDTGLAGAEDERRREPLRGDAQYQASAAVRAVRSLANCRSLLGGAFTDQIAHDRHAGSNADASVTKS